MKRLGIVQGALGWWCALGLVCCGGRTPVDWNAGETGGRGSGGNATGGKVVTPNTGGTGGVPASGTGGGGAGGKVNPATGGVSGSGSAVGMCAPGLVLCGKSCVNLRTDANHCGSCLQACGDSSCVDGACAIGKCPFPLVACGSQCIDPTSDPNFCGASGSCTGPVRGQSCVSPAQCRQGRCEATPRSCLSILEAGRSIGDNYYEIAPSPDPARLDKAFCDMTREGGGWTRCLEVRNSVNEDLDGSTWFDRCVDWTMAEWSRGELLLELRDTNGVLVYIGRGKRNGPWTYNALTSTGVPNDQASLSLHNAIPLSSSDWLWITGRSASNQGCVGAQGNGYGILLTPEPAPASQTPMRLMVMPYRLQVDSHEPRQFGFDNRQWFPSNEISFAATTPFSTCVAPPPFLGSFEFYVR